MNQNELKNLITYQDGSVVSKEILKANSGTITLFAFAAGQGLSEHTAPFEAFVNIIEGEATIIIAGTPHLVSEGEMIILPANKPHALKADKRFKMLLVMLKN